MMRSTNPIHHRLLQLIHEHRFATTRQLMRLTSTSYSSERSALRQTLRHLDTLRERHLITRLERRVGGWQGGSAVSIWTLTTKGSRALTGSRTRRRPRHLSTTFLEHLLAVSETRVVLSESATNGTDMEIEITGEPACWRRYVESTGSAAVLKPDLAVKVVSAAFVDRYFVEVDRATENPARVIGKCWHYVRYRRSGAEQSRNDGIFPAVVWLVPHLERRIQIERAIALERELPRGLFIVTTLDDLPHLVRAGPATS